MQQKAEDLSQLASLKSYYLKFSNTYSTENESRRAGNLSKWNKKLSEPMRQNWDEQRMKLWINEKMKRVSDARCDPWCRKHLRKLPKRVTQLSQVAHRKKKWDERKICWFTSRDCFRLQKALAFRNWSETEGKISQGIEVEVICNLFSPHHSSFYWSLSLHWWMQSMLTTRKRRKINMTKASKQWTSNRPEWATK